MKDNLPFWERVAAILTISALIAIVWCSVWQDSQSVELEGTLYALQVQHFDAITGEALDQLTPTSGKLLSMSDCVEALFDTGPQPVLHDYDHPNGVVTLYACVPWPHEPKEA